MDNWIEAESSENAFPPIAYNSYIYIFFFRENGNISEAFSARDTLYKAIKVERVYM